MDQEEHHKMKNVTLVIMAAGIGSRFGGGIKQLEPVGPNGEIIMDYSIHDALEAGCNKVVFIIRKDIDAYSAESAHPFRRNGAPFRFKLSSAQIVN